MTAIQFSRFHKPHNTNKPSAKSYVHFDVATRNPIQDRVPLLSSALSNIVTVVFRACVVLLIQLIVFFSSIEWDESPSLNRTREHDRRAYRADRASIFENLKSIYMPCVLCLVSKKLCVKKVRRFTKKVFVLL